MLDVDQLNGFFDRFYLKSAFRLETLDAYWVDSDGDDYHRYLVGETAPTPERKEPWLATLRHEKAVGRLRHRVRLLHTPLNDYLRYACEWGYALNSAAGEIIRVIDLTEKPYMLGLRNAGDWWLLDDSYVLRMIYDDQGRFVGAEPNGDLALYQRARDDAIAASEPFDDWWGRHPEEHRDNRAA